MEWYYEYIIKQRVSPDSKETEILSGVVLAESFDEAVQQITNYYGEKEILEVQMLKPIIESSAFSSVFDFQDAMENDLDFEIYRKV